MTNKTLRLPDGALITVRRAQDSDATELTKVLHDAFEVWKKEGLRFGPMYQTEAQTLVQVRGRVFVAEDTEGKILGTFGLDADGATLLEYLDVPHKVLPGKLLAFKKAAVLSRYAHKGLGTRLYILADDIGRDEGYAWW